MSDHFDDLQRRRNASHMPWQCDGNDDCGTEDDSSSGGSGGGC